MKTDNSNVDFTNLPEHVAIIMDGNRRYAKQRLHLPTKAGHAAGAQNLRRLAERMNALGFKHLTVYAFAVKNWRRSAAEVGDLMSLFRQYIGEYFADREQNNIVIRFLGDRSHLDDDLRDDMERLYAVTKDRGGMSLNIALNYGGRDEIVRAARRIAEDAVSGRVNPANIDEGLLNGYMDTKDLPEPDLIIRTGGEQRLSDFLLWQSADSELVFTDKLWPEFGEKELLTAVAEYQRRERKFGR